MAARLSVKSKVFVEYLLGEAKFDQTTAARMAGYGSPHVAGSTLLESPKVLAYLDKRLKELGSSKNESLMDLARMARGAMQYFYDPAQDMFDLTTEQAIRNIDLIKSMTIDSETRTDKKTGETITRTRKKIEVTDKLAARIVLAKVQGLLNADVIAQTIYNTTNNNSLVVGSLDDLAKSVGVTVGDLMSEAKSIINEYDAKQLRAPAPEDSSVVDAEVIASE